MIARDATLRVAEDTADGSTSDGNVRALRRRAPRFRRHVVERTRLLSVLAGARDHLVVQICAPAGFGKTILAAQLSVSDPRPSCWIALEDADNDSVVLLTDIVHRLAELGPISPRVTHAVEAPDVTVEKVLPILASHLSACDPFVLVLDDVELVTQRESLAILSFLVDHAPLGSQVVLCTRMDAPIPLGRLRAAGEVLDLRAADLAFDAAETRELLGGRGEQLSDEQVEEIRRRTEGWATAIALAMPDRGPGVHGSAVDAIGGSREVAAYLIEEAVESQPPEVRQFLLASSLLRRMSPALCDAALGTASSGRILAALEQECLFVIRLDRDGEWYRYHRLFRALLGAEVRRQRPEIVEGVLSRAAAWHEERGESREAFEYALASADPACAARVILRTGETLIACGQLETARVWLARCTPEMTMSDPHLALAGAWVSVESGDAAEAWRLAALAGGAADLDVPSLDGATSLRSSIARLRATLASDGISQMLRDGEFVVDAEQVAGTRWVMDGWRQVATAHLLSGRPDEAIAAFVEVLLRSRGNPDLSHLTVHVLGYSALAAADAGDWRRARKWAREAQALTMESGLEHTVHAVAPGAAQATVLLHDGLLPQATRALEQVQTMIPRLHAMRWFEADISLRCADAGLDLGDIESALDLADVARGALNHYPDPGNLAARLDAVDSRLRSGGALELTPSEMRLIPFLPSHLSLREIGDRFYLSRATVKTHTDSIYRKLTVSSRSAAVERLEALGLCQRQPAWAPIAAKCRPTA